MKLFPSVLRRKRGVIDGAAILPALPHALIDCSDMTSIQDYLKDFKNLKRKLRVFEIKGGEFLGYQAAIKTGRFLNALHGAFDRNRKTTYHAYDILFVKMTEYAIEQGLQIIDFGAVLNYTKQKMVNKTMDMSYFLMSKHSVTQWFFNKLLKFTKIQSRSQLKFVETF